VQSGHSRARPRRVTPNDLQDEYTLSVPKMCEDVVSLEAKATTAGVHVEGGDKRQLMLEIPNDSAHNITDGGERSRSEKAGTSADCAASDGRPSAFVTVGANSRGSFLPVALRNEHIIMPRLVHSHVDCKP
jgi:hypothetical protein